MHGRTQRYSSSPYATRFVPSNTPSATHSALTHSGLSSPMRVTSVTSAYAASAVAATSTDSVSVRSANSGSFAASGSGRGPDSPTRETTVAMGAVLPCGAMRIEPLPPSMADAAVALWHEAGLTRPWNDPHADLALALRGPSSTVLAALDGDALVGTAMVGHDGHRGWVYYLGVATAARRRGVGRALMAAAEEWLREREIPALNLMVRSDNTEALGFYDRLGYETGKVVVRGRRLDAAQ